MDNSFLHQAKLTMLFLTLLLCVYVKSVSLLEMVTSGKIIALNQGENILLPCEFISYSFDLFSNPVQWKKTQRTHTEPMNLMSNIKEPFFQTNRFGVSFQDTQPRYQMQMSIMNVAPEDSGNYTCEIRGPEGNILAQVTHYLFVRAFVEFLAITNENKSVIPRHRDPIIFSELFKSNILRCVSIGGLPPPEIRVYIGNKDISDQLHWRQETKLRGPNGLSLMIYHSERYSYNFRAEPAYDGLEVTCAVNVAGLGFTNHTMAVMHVNYAPRIQCFDSSAKVGDDLVHVTCDIRAKPAVKMSYWILDDNGTQMPVPSVMNQYWTIHQNLSNGVLRSSLYWKKTNESSFRTYELVAENDIGISARAARLIRIISVPTQEFSVRHKPKTDNRKRQDYFVYQPNEAAEVTSLSNRLYILVLCGTVLSVQYIFASEGL